MTLALLNLEITPERGNAALLPNQPILQGCVVSASETATLVPGDIVALATGGVDDTIVVKKAAVTDTPIGVVVGNPIKTGWKAGERVSVFPEGSYVYMTTGAASIARGSKLQYNSSGNVVATTTSTSSYIGVALSTQATSGGVIVVQVKAEAPSA